MTRRFVSATRDTFRSLRVRNFRLFFVGQTISQSGTWLQMVALSWLVLRLGGDGTDLGWVMAAQFLPMLLFGAWGGVVADRLDKHRLLLVTQTVSMVQAAAMSALVFTDVISIGMVYALAAVLGLATAIDNPARRALVVEMVGPADVANAVSLNSAVMTTSRVIGPAVAGVLIATVGIGWCFAVNAASYLAVLAGLLLMRRRELSPSPRVAREKGQVRDGLRYVWSRPDLRVPLLVMAVVGTLGFNFQVVLPLLATRTFDGDAGTFSIMFSTMSMGSVIGALTVARRRSVTPVFLARAALAFGVAMTAVALSPTLPIAVAAGVLMGGTGVCFLSGSTALLNLRADPVMRGRVLALSAIVFLGSTPIGGPIVGWVSEHLGPRYGLGLGAVASLLAGTAALRWMSTRAAALGPGEAGLDVEVVGQVEDPLGDDVALHLAGATADGESRREEEAVVPGSGVGPQRAPVGQHPAGAGEVLGQAHEPLPVLVGDDLADRRLRARVLSLDPGRDRAEPDQP